MMPNSNVKSLRRILLFLIVGVAFTFFLLVAVYITTSFEKNSKQLLSNNITNWAQYLSQVSLNYLKEDISPDTNNEATSVNSYSSKQKQLFTIIEALDKVNDIKLINIYDKEKSLFLTYYPKINSDYATDKTTSSPIERSFKQFTNAPHFFDNVVAYYVPIIDKDKTPLGYVYLEMKLAGAVDSTAIIIQLIIIAFIFLIAIWVTTAKIENVVATPLGTITSEIQHIARTKDFTQRLASMDYQEADMVARNINNLLTRVEKHIAKLNEAEKLSQKQNEELQNKITSRTTALKESNQELLSALEKLHQFQDQLVESGKMASLGDMVAGIAHEVNTPIGLGVTASTLLADRLKEMKEHFDNKTLRSSQLKRFFNEGEENVGIVYRNLKRAAELISSFKKVAVDQSSEDVRQFNMNELLKEVLLTLAPQIKKTPYIINTHCNEDIVIWSKPGPINQILINLIMNSIIHGFEDRDEGVIDINISLDGSTINIDYQDNGKGIDRSIRDKIFDPFTTTKRGSGGSGLGLHLVYNLVTQALGGNITLDSIINEGTEFKIAFPIDSETNSA